MAALRSVLVTAIVWAAHVGSTAMLRCTRSERAAAAVTALLLLHHGEWCAWHVLAVTGRLVGAGEAYGVNSIYAELCKSAQASKTVLDPCLGMR